MLVNRNYRNAFILTGLLVCIVTFLTACTALCFANVNGLDGAFDIGCTASSHTFVHIGLRQAAFFGLIFVGIVGLPAFTAIPEGLLLSLFKPSRYQTDYFKA